MSIHRQPLLVATASTHIRVTVAFIFIALGFHCEPACADSPNSAQAECERPLVVVNYFAGWWKELPNKWHGRGWNDQEPDWRPAYPGRVPILGEYNNQATMDREIAAAADYGVDAFAMLWYYPQPGQAKADAARRLNRGVTTYMASPNAERMAFFIEYCNARGFNAVNEEQWQECIATWVNAMKHPSYLRIDGRLVLKIHSVHQFLQTHGEDLALCRERLDTLRAAVRSAGLGEMIIGGGIPANAPTLVAHWPAAKLFDFTGTYMSVPLVESRSQTHPYSVLAQEIRSVRPQRAQDAIPWMPYLSAGWNPRPWSHTGAASHYHRFFDFPTRGQFTAELKTIKDAFATHPSFGLPRKDGTRRPIFTIYAWNEFGEGGMVAPTKGRGHMMLQCIKDVFEVPTRPHPKESLPKIHATQSRKPNVIVILADDLGYADLGCQGSPDVKTPHIDSLAENGVRCTAGYVTAPQCGPSRAAILTGRYQNRFGSAARTNHDALAKPAWQAADSRMPH